MKYKTNIIEVIALLYFIAGLLVHNWFHWVLFTLAVENIIESMIWSYKEHKE